MMKKINIIILNLILLFSITSLVFAEDVVDSSINNSEALILSNIDGAQVRLLQLESRLDVQISNSEEIINKIKEDNSEFDVNRLEEINLELTNIKEDITNFNLDSDVDSLVKEYLNLKSSAIELSKEFKEIAQNALPEDIKEQLREQTRKNVKNRAGQNNNKVKAAMNRYNAQKAEEFMNKFGIKDTELLDKIKAGQTEMTQVKNQLKKSFNNLDKEKKNLVLKKINTERNNTKNEYQMKFREMTQKMNKNLGDETKKITEKYNNKVRNLN